MQYETQEYVRDEKTNALLKVDTKGLQEYLSKRASAKRLTDIENDLAETKSDIKQIKALLLQLTEKNG